MYKSGKYKAAFIFLWKNKREQEKKMISKITVKHKTKVKRSTKWLFLARKYV